MKMKFERIVDRVGLTLLIAWVVLVFASLGHCVTTARPNGLGVFQTYDNPYTYIVGTPSRITLLEDKDYYYTNVEFKALGDSLINTVPILFCDDQTSAFEDARLRAVTYRISATRSHKGVGCHEILPTQSGVIIIEED